VLPLIKLYTPFSPSHKTIVIVYKVKTTHIEQYNGTTVHTVHSDGSII